MNVRDTREANKAVSQMAGLGLGVYCMDGRRCECPRLHLVSWVYCVTRRNLLI